MGKVVDINDATKPKAQRKGARGTPERSKAALVLAGGGFTGGVYQIGALRALDLLATNISVNEFDIYVGTSCGAFVGALVANGARPEDLMALLDGKEIPGYEPLDMGRLMRPNYRDIAGRSLRLPWEAASIAKDVALNFRRLSLTDVMSMVGDALPASFYSLDGMAEMMRRQLGRAGFTDDFRELERELYIVATDIDTCDPVVFGDEGWDDVPISSAMAASGSLPLIYKGVSIRGREFVDGGLRGFANIETAVDHGAKLVVIVNPIVPFRNERLAPFSGERPKRVSQGGLVNVGAQMFKCLIWSAFHERLERWQQLHPDVDFILIEPQRDDELMFGTQILNVSQRVQIARHGFESVTVQLASDFERYKEICGRHGIKISRKHVISALQSTEQAPSGTTRWKRILEQHNLGRDSG
jgi:predicted acylesterase/phospholipase RssA